jgi:4-amino-4-deoxy-L-arabinose transferase-like glycosyltransferase
MDDGLYDQMALEILGGNWIGDFPLGPYRLPGYAYFLAGVYKLFGHRIDAVHFLQAGLGATSVLLVYFLSREIFKDVRAAVVSSALTLLYMPLSYFENFLLGETLAIFLTLAAVCLVVRALRGPNPAAGLLAPGLLLGVSALFRPNVLLPCGFLAVFFLLYPVVRGKAWGKGFAAAAVFSLACVAPLAPVAVRNWKLYHDFVPISAIGGVNFYLGNNAEAIGSFVETKGLSGNLDDILHESISQAEEAAGRPLKASEVSAYWSKKAFDFLAARPALAARVFGVKLNTLLNNDEMPDVLDMYFVAGFMPLLKLYRVVGFSLILLASFFAWPLLRRAEAVGPPREEPSRGGAPGGAAVVGVFLAGYALSVLAIFVSSRYRLPLVPFLAVFAGAGVVGLWELARARRVAGLAVTAAAAAALVPFAYRPILADFTSTNYDRLAIYYQYKGDPENAEKTYLKAIAAQPEDPYPYNNYAVLLHETGRDEEADAMGEKSQELLRKAGLYNRFISSGSDTR